MDLSNRTDLKLLRKEIEAALDAVAKKHGIIFEQGSIKYDGSGMKCRLELKVEKIATAGETSFKKIEWDRHAIFHGLAKEHFGATFVANGETFEIVEILPKSRKYPVVAKSKATGKMLKFSAEYIRMKLVMSR